MLGKPPDKPPQGTTRDRLIQAAGRLFLAKGYEATGVAEILREADVRSGSLYYFFRTKEDLLLAVLDGYAGQLHPMLGDPEPPDDVDPIEHLLGMFAGFRRTLAETDCRQGSLIGNLALEMSEKSEAVRHKVVQHFEDWRRSVRRCLHRAADRLPPGLSLDRLSIFVLTVLEGGVMQARAYRSLEPFDASVSMLRDTFDRLRATRTNGTGAYHVPAKG